MARAESQAVLLALYKDSQPEAFLPDILRAELPSIEDARTLQLRLGGVIKIAVVDTETTESKTASLEEEAALVLIKLAGGKKITFGVAELGRDTLKAIELFHLKEKIQEAGITARFVDGPRYGLSASVLLHQNVDEVVIVRKDNQVLIGHTIAIQNIDDWTLRDRQKPAVDPRHGMLPPKVARMLINLALPIGAEGKRVLDPFCGTGTVVMEALMLGAEGIGSDLRVEAVGQTQKNCEWLSQAYHKNFTFRAVTSDATHLTPELLGGKVDAIATEGYLGPLTPRPGAVPNLFKGLEKLYKGAFKQWTEVLVPGARVCIALPNVSVKGNVFSLAPLIDSLSSYGYNISSGPYLYERPDAVVRREIFVLEFKK